MAKASAQKIQAWLDLGYDENTVWDSLTPGPAIADVAALLSSVPRDFLSPRVSLTALAGDVLGSVHESLAPILATAQRNDASRRAAALMMWLWSSDQIIGPLQPALNVRWTALAALSMRLAPMVDPSDWLTNDRNREEAVRLLLLWSRQLPAGEDAVTARALWERHDSIRRNAALAAALKEHNHRLEVTRALAKKRAAEAVPRYSHE